HDYGFPLPGRVGSDALVAVLGNQYSVPIIHVGAPVIARVHRERVALWRDAELLVSHARAPDGAHHRVVEPEHFAPLFRQALLELGVVAHRYIGELSRRQRARLREEILRVYALYQQHGAAALLEAMERAKRLGAYGAAYLHALAGGPALSAADIPPLALADAPAQAEIDRALSAYEAYVRVSEVVS